MSKTIYLPLLLAGAAVTPSIAAERPNVILIMADDLGWGDVGFNGNTTIKTPRMDEIVKDGVIFERFYSARAVSSPTRASVLTGRNPYRTGVFSANIGILRPEEVTIAEMLQEAGYATGHFGKWHLGTLTDQMRDANRARVGGTTLLNPPAQHGYDAAMVSESSVPTYDPMRKPTYTTADGKKPRWWSAIPKDAASLYNGTAYWDIDGDRVEENLEGDDSRVIMDRVIPFIDSAVDAKKPFFSVVWFHAPHVQFVAGPEYAALYEGYTEEQRNYYGCITALDEQVGRLVDHLKANGTYDNTVVMFCSDNGPEVKTPGEAGKLRGLKRALYEGGIRVPAFALWGDKIEKNVRTSTPCFTSDYLPMVAEVTGVKLPADRELDGESFVDELRGREWHRQKPLIFCFRNLGAVMRDSLKLYYESGVYELYDIDKDPSERHNIIEQYPAQAEAMKSELLEAMKSYQMSFEGGEYGTASLNRVKQKWSSIY